MSSSSSDFEEHDFLTSSSDEEFLIDAVQPKTKNENYLQTVNAYTDAEFLQHFRVGRHVAINIAERLKNSQYFTYQIGEFGKLSAIGYVFVFLWFAGHEAASYRDVADRFGISISSLRKIIERMIYFISNLSVETIKWPTDAETLEIELNFRENGFPVVIGVIDGSHIKIDKPENDPDSYINRKHFFSIQMQVVCDHQRKIRDIYVGFPGSVHDSRVFRASPLSDFLNQKCGNYHILGDSGYPCLRNLMTPFKDRGNLTRRQINYNIKLSKNRYIIEHCFGIMKQKFRQLYHLKLRKINDIVHFIRACAVLHNLALEDNFLINENELEENNQMIDIGDVQYDGEEDGMNVRVNIANTLPMN